jgi:hypothetical protein
MKGMDLTVTTIILIILGLIVFLAAAYIISTSNGQVNIIQAQSALRTCCGDRSVYDCSPGADVSSKVCRVPWSSEKMSISDLANIVGIDTLNRDSLNGFCFC